MPKSSLSLGKRMEEKQTLHGRCTSSKLLQKHKASTYNSISLLQSYEIWKQYKIVVPVGAGTYIFFLFLYTVSMLNVDP